MCGGYKSASVFSGNPPKRDSLSRGNRQSKRVFGDIFVDKFRGFSWGIFFSSAQRSRGILGVLYNSFDKSLTFDFVHATLYCKSDHFTYIKPPFDFIFRPAATPNHFAAIHLRQNPLAPARRIFYFLIDLQPGNRFAILVMHLENCISRPDWIQRHDPAQMRASLTTPLQNRGRNLIRGERRPHKQETSRFTFTLPSFKPEFVLLFGFSKLTEKVESKYRPVATISQIEIASHAPVVLVGECLPQTLFIFCALRDLRLRRNT